MAKFGVIPLPDDYRPGDCHNCPIRLDYMNEWSQWDEGCPLFDQSDCKLKIIEAEGKKKKEK